MTLVFNNKSLNQNNLEAPEVDSTKGETMKTITGIWAATTSSTTACT